MSTYSPPPPTTSYQPPPSNGLGMTGFILSITGLVVCAGFICPIGLVMSMIALGKEPRGFAIAGTIIGLLGSLMAASILLVAFGTVGNGWAIQNMFNTNMVTHNNMYAATVEIDQYYTNNNQTLPDEPTGTSLMANHVDEWGTSFKYVPTSQHGGDYDLISAGPDLQFNTNDDIVDYFWVNSHMVTPHGPAAPQQGMDEQSISYAFDQAEKAINNAYPPGSTMPNNADGNALLTGALDAWGRQLQYHATGNPPFFHLKSAGPDGVWQNEDDLIRSFYFEPTGSQ